ncbi:hypothetical protein AY599_26195 [Leptolyngbya valderiana BDU 20041]|nr:hypothetical protein AY599_26195 [Leptolyngbya valderiana BDU 20041]
MNEISIIRLAESISEGELRELNQAEVSTVLGWVTRSKSTEHRQALEKALGSAEAQPELALNALRILECSLFFDDVFQQSKAGVSHEFEHDARRRRYRLLLSAFHPDRVPDQADWLTQRSQSIIRAYQDFKRNPDAAAEDARPEAGARQGPAQAGRTPPHRGPIKHRESSLTMYLRERFGGDRWLAHKVVGALVLLLGLAVVSVLISEPAAIRATSPATGPTARADTALEPQTRTPRDTSGPRTAGGERSHDGIAASRPGDEGGRIESNPVRDGVGVVQSGASDSVAGNTTSPMMAGSERAISGGAASGPGDDRVRSESNPTLDGVGVVASGASDSAAPETTAPRTAGAEPSLAGSVASRSGDDRARTESNSALNSIAVVPSEASDSAAPETTAPMTAGAEPSLAGSVASRPGDDGARTASAVTDRGGAAPDSAPGIASAERSPNGTPPSQADPTASPGIDRPDTSPNSAQGERRAAQAAVVEPRQSEPTLGHSETSRSGLERPALAAATARADARTPDRPARAESGLGAPSDTASARPGPGSSTTRDPSSIAEAAPAGTRPAPRPAMEPPVARNARPSTGQLSLGPVMQHRVGELLQSYQQAFEAGDLDRLMGLFGDRPRFDRQLGREPLERYFTSLFEASGGRRLSLTVRSAERAGNDWIVGASQRIELLDGADRAPRVQELDLVFQFAPSPFALKITGIQATDRAN